MQGIVERRTTIPVLSHLLLTAKGDRLHVAATDLDVSLVSSVGADVRKEGALAVQARKLIEIVRSLESETIDLALAMASARCGSRRANRNFKHPRSAGESIFRRCHKSTGTESDPGTAAGAAALVGKMIFAVFERRVAFPALGCAAQAASQNRAELVATDGHRLALRRRRDCRRRRRRPVLVPRKALQEILRFEGEGDLESFPGRAPTWRSAPACAKWSVAFSKGTFPDYERVIARNNDKKIVCDRRALGDAVQRVALMSGDRNRGVRLEFGEGESHGRGGQPDLGEASETLVCEYERRGDPHRVESRLSLALSGRVETERVLTRAQGREQSVRRSPGSRRRTPKEGGAATNATSASSCRCESERARHSAPAVGSRRVSPHCSRLPQLRFPRLGAPRRPPTAARCERRRQDVAARGPISGFHGSQLPRHDARVLSAAGRRGVEHSPGRRRSAGTRTRNHLVAGRRTSAHARRQRAAASRAPARVSPSRLDPGRERARRRSSGGAATLRGPWFGASASSVARGFRPLLPSPGGEAGAPRDRWRGAPAHELERATRSPRCRDCRGSCRARRATG
jgi:DNA polymerase III subunit beta